MLVRDEYPRPNFVRKIYQSLNGIWEFSFDDNNEGLKNELYKENKTLNMQINVPFAFQSKESGIGDNSTHNIIWYKRKFELKDEFKNHNVFLCFNAVDYDATIYVNGKYVLNHKNSYSYFDVDITSYLKKGSNDITLRIEDNDDIDRPRGKQYWHKEVDRCWYRRTSGIWQSVWLEATGTSRIVKYKITPNIDENNIFTELTVSGKATKLDVSISYKGKAVKNISYSVDGKYTKQTINLLEYDAIDEMHFWHPNHPNLYDVKLSLYENDKLVDEISTYFGFRKVSYDKNSGVMMINNIPFYSKLILDQGYWEDSDLTAPSIESLKQDIVLAKQMGFNGARKHQKIEDPYFYYYADVLGYVVWGELPSAYSFCDEEMNNLMSQQIDLVEQLYNHPSVVVWVPLNESWGVRKILLNEKQQAFAKAMYYMTHAIDNTRLVSSNDGWENLSENDIVSIHSYSEYGNEFEEKFNQDNYDKVFPMFRKLVAQNQNIQGIKPVILTEFGGVSLRKFEKDESSWGYNKSENEEGFIERLSILMSNVKKVYLQGYCYTQLSDVQQETNGLLDAKHNPKLDIEKIRKIFGD